MLSMIVLCCAWVVQINTCNGYYCDGWKPKSPNKPVFWTEDWNGWYVYMNLIIELFQQLGHLCSLSPPASTLSTP